MTAPPTMRPHGERGLALVCALLLMVAAMVIGVAVARGAFALLASARNEADRVTARLAAEAALLDAERDIASAGSGLGAGAGFGTGAEAGTGAAPGADAGPGSGAGAGAAAARAMQFGPSGNGFVDGCGRGAADLGLCSATTPPVWHAIDLAADDSEVLVPYGRYTGAVLPLGEGTLPVRLPGYLIEKLAPPGATPAQGSFYRITAIGFGMRASTRVVLQSLYRLPAPAGASPGAAAGEGAAAEDGAGGAGSSGGADRDGPGNADDDAADDADGGADGSADGPADGGGRGPGPPAGALPVPIPAGRIGWREIANWPELHARAIQ